MLENQCVWFFRESAVVLPLSFGSIFKTEASHGPTQESIKFKSNSLKCSWASHNGYTVSKTQQRKKAITVLEVIFVLTLGRHLQWKGFRVEDVISCLHLEDVNFRTSLWSHVSCTDMSCIGLPNIHLLLNMREDNLRITKVNYQTSATKARIKYTVITAQLRTQMWQFSSDKPVLKCGKSHVMQNL
jgi:hypothetical protein